MITKLFLGVAFNRKAELPIMGEEAEPRYYCMMFWLQQMGIFHQFNFTVTYWFLFPLLSPLLRPKKRRRKKKTL